MTPVDHDVTVDGPGAEAWKSRGIPVSLTGRSDDPVRTVLTLEGAGGINLGNASSGPLAATISSPPDQSLRAEVGVNVANSDDKPFAAVVSGPDGKPVEATVTASIGGTTTPIQVGGRVDLGVPRFTPDLTTRILLFGFIPLFTIRFTGSTNVGP